MSVILADNRRAIRSMPNPQDISTIVSIFPKNIDEVKHTIQPGRFIIPAGSYDKPSILVVGQSSWWRDIDEHQPLLEIPTSSIQIADSVVKDYAQSVIEWADDAKPGLFWIPGNVTVEMLKKEHKVLLDDALRKQRNWYSGLVRLADILWANSNNNPIVISSDMRLAAQELGLKKVWMQDSSTIEMVPCKACGSLRNPSYPVCQVCRAIDDPDKAKELGIKFAS